MMNDPPRPDEIGDSNDTPASVSRRHTLASLLGIGGLSLVGSRVARGAPPAGAGPPPRSWNQDVDAQGNRLLDLGALAMSDDTSEIARFEGENLTVDGSRTLNAIDTHTDVSDGGVLRVPDADDINFGSHLTVTDDGGGSVTVDAAGSSWEDADDDGLLETDSNGVEVDTVRTSNLSVGNVGLSVELGSVQTIEGGASRVVVGFDDTAFDDRDEFDTTDHQFVASQDGTYHVDLYVSVGSVEGDFGATVEVEQFFDDIAGPSLALANSGTGSATTLSLSRTLRLSEGDALKVVISNLQPDSSRSVFAGRQSCLSIHQVG